MKYFTYRALC